MNTLYYGDNLKILGEGGNPRGSEGVPDVPTSVEITPGDTLPTGRVSALSL